MGVALDHPVKEEALALVPHYRVTVDLARLSLHLTTEYLPDVPDAKSTTQTKDYRPASTWHRKPWYTRSFPQHLVGLGLMSEEYHQLKPPTISRGPVPKHPRGGEHWWILTRAMVAPLLQQTWYTALPGYKWPAPIAFLIYTLCFMFFVIGCVRRFDYFAKIYGTLDEQVIGRDRIPDASVGQLCKALILAIAGRMVGAFYLRWNKADMPLDGLRWSTPVRLFIWLIVFDYFFYAYHRSCHEFDFLWRIHRQHHTTRHPSPVLTILAEDVQEVIELFLCPLAATLLVPMTFHELFFGACYMIYVEILGHSGIRAQWETPITGPILKLIGCELIIEDHDLHHRNGKSGKNYCKQTRLWDVLFGTTGPRQEMANMPGMTPY